MGEVKKNDSTRHEYKGKSCSGIITVYIKSKDSQIEVPIISNPAAKQFCTKNCLRKIDPAQHSFKESGKERKEKEYRYLKYLLSQKEKNKLEEENIAQYTKDSAKFETRDYDFISIVGGSENTFNTLKEKIKGDKDVCALLQKATGDENAHDKVDIVLTHLIATICAMEIQDLSSNGKLCSFLFMDFFEAYSSH